MGHRRANGEGAIYPVAWHDTAKKRPKVWRGSIELGYRDGVRVRKTVQDKTRSAVAAKLDALKRQHASGVDLFSKPPTLEELLKQWMENAFSLIARPKSIWTYQQRIDKDILPHLGHIRIDRLSAPLVQRWIKTLEQAELAAATITLDRTILYQAMQQAVEWQLVEQNVVARTKPPARQPSPAQALTVEQAQHLLAAAQGEPLELALRLILALGLRRGEVCGLRWFDICFEAGSLTVNGSLAYVAGKGLIYGAPKTKSGRRTLKLPASLVEALKRHRETLLLQRAAMGAAWSDCDYVFVAATTGGPLNTGVLYDCFRRVVDRSGIEHTGGRGAGTENRRRFRLHDLRHSTASFLIAEGVHPKIISAMLGHANIQITMDLYGHLFPDAFDDPAQRMERLFGSSLQPSQDER